MHRTRREPLPYSNTFTTIIEVSHHNPPTFICDIIKKLEGSREREGGVVYIVDIFWIMDTLINLAVVILLNILKI